MRELTVDEVEMVDGAGYLIDMFHEVQYVVRGLPDLYQDAIMSATDMMCIATGRC